MQEVGPSSELQGIVDLMMLSTTAMSGSSRCQYQLVRCEVVSAAISACVGTIVVPWRRTPTDLPPSFLGSMPVRAYSRRGALMLRPFRAPCQAREQEEARSFSVMWVRVHPAVLQDAAVLWRYVEADIGPLLQASCTTAPIALAKDDCAFKLPTASWSARSLRSTRRTCRESTARR